MRLCGRKSRRSFSQPDFRTQKLLSQDGVPNNSSMLRSSTLFVPRGHAKLVSPFGAIWLGSSLFEYRMRPMAQLWPCGCAAAMFVIASFYKE